MTEFALIACRVTSETKARVRRLTERDGITESTLLRQLLDVVLRMANLDEPPTMAVPHKVNRDMRASTCDSSLKTGGYSESVRRHVAWHQPPTSRTSTDRCGTL